MPRRPEENQAPDAARPSKYVFESPTISIGQFRCPAGHRAWREENYIGPSSLIVFPRVPVRIKHTDKEGVVADANHVMFYNADQFYTRGLLNERGDACEWYLINESILAEIVAEFDPAAGDHRRAPFPFPHGPSDPGCYLDQRAIFEYVTHQAEPDTLLIQETILGVVRRVVAAAFAARGQRPKRTRTDQAHRDVSEAARECIARRFSEPLTLEDLADAVHVSPFHLCRVFRRQTGLTLHQYRGQLRLRTSLELLADRGADLTRIALRLGYSSHAHFTSAFKRTFGVCPSQIRGAAIRDPQFKTSRILKDPPFVTA